MLFDLRGRRKRFIQVIYAVLAVLMGGGLVLFGIGSDVQGGLFDAFSEQGGATSSFSDDADEIEEKLQTRPNDENLLAQLVQTRYSAGNAGIEVDSSGQQSITAEAREQFERATDAWDRYLRVAEPEPNPNIALLAANTAYLLAQTSSTTNEADANLETAAAAQRIVADARPSVGTLSTLASYLYYVLDFKGGDAATKKAAAEAGTKARRKAIERQLAGLRKQLKAYEKQVKAAEKAGGGQGAEALENPLGGLSGGGAAPGAPPAP
jgi:hypothetical protein